MSPHRTPPARIGTASWSIPQHYRAHFPGGSSILARYAGRFSAVEINSSFYRPHRTATYARWAAAVPTGFRFAVKLPKAVTHEHRLVGADDLIEHFLGEVAGLGEKLGPLLVQLPPSLTFEQSEADTFFSCLRRRCAAVLSHEVAVACEPRHRSWFSSEVDAILVAHRVARVAADPPPAPSAAEPGGWQGLVYRRLHGSPRMYWSNYGPDAIQTLKTELVSHPGEVWCIFDNTAAGCATGNALDLLSRLEPNQPR